MLVPKYLQTITIIKMHIPTQVSFHHGEVKYKLKFVTIKRLDLVGGIQCIYY